MIYRNDSKRKKSNQALTITDLHMLTASLNGLPRACNLGPAPALDGRLFVEHHF